MNFNFDRHIRLDRTLNEGGNAIKSSSPVSGDKALPIAEKVIGILKERYPDTEFAPIGSVGKKNAEQTSGDIDIAVGLDFSESENVKEVLKEKYPDMEIKSMKGLHILSVGLPYESQVVQVDLMFFPDIELAKFFYHSPDFTKNESEFKGSVRNMLMTSILKNIPVQDYRNTTFENGHVKDLYKYSFNPEKGLVILHQSFEGKDGQERKTKQTIKDDTVEVSKNVEEIVKFMMGEDADLSTVSSFESMVDWMRTDKFPYSDFNEHIFEDLMEYVDKQTPEFIEDVRNYINSGNKGISERKVFRKLGDVLKESFIKKTADKDSTNSIVDKADESVKITFEMTIGKCMELVRHLLNEDYLESDEEEITDNQTFLCIPLNDTGESYTSEMNLDLRSKHFFLIYSCYNKSIDDNEYYSFDFDIHWDEKPSDGFLSQREYDEIVNMYRHVLERIQELGGVYFDSMDLSSVAESLEELEVTGMITKESYEKYLWAKEQVSEEEDDEYFNESFIRKTTDKNAKDLESSADEITFNVEEVLKKIVEMYSSEGHYSAETYSYIWLPMPYEGDINEDDTFVNDEGLYPTAVLFSKYNDGGVFDTTRLLVRFAENNPNAEVSAENDEYFSELSLENQRKICSLVADVFGVPFSELVKKSEDFHLQESLLTESFIGRIGNRKGKDLRSDADKVFEMTPDSAMEIIRQKVFNPLEWVEGDEADGKDYHISTDHNSYHDNDVITCYFGIEGFDYDYEDEFSMEIRFCNFGLSYPNFSKEVRGKWGISFRFGISSCSQGDIDFVLGDKLFRNPSDYRDYYKLNYQSIGTLIDILKLIGLRHPYDETVGYEGGPYHTLSYGDESVYSMFIYCDTFNLSELYKYMDESSKDFYDLTKESFQENDEFYDEEDY